MLYSEAMIRIQILFIARENIFHKEVIVNFGNFCIAYSQPFIKPAL